MLETMCDAAQRVSRLHCLTILFRKAERSQENRQRYDEFDGNRPLRVPEELADAV
jgi:hypothetical protein